MGVYRQPRRALSKRGTLRPAVFLSAIALIAGGIVVAPTAASAQGGAADQYGGVGPAGGSGQDDGGQGSLPTGGAGGTEAGTGETGGGSLPFTGYPLTPLAALFLLLLAAGVIIRVASAKRADVAGSAAISGPPLR
jgi:hypothetical protein